MQTALLQQSGLRALPQRAQMGSSISRRSAQIARPMPALRVAAEEVVVSTNGIVAEAPPAPIGLNIDEIQELIKLVHSTDIATFELKGKHFNLTVKTEEALRAEQAPVQYVQAAAPVAAAPTAPAPAPAAPAPAPAAAAPAPAPAAPKAAAPPKVEGVEMTSPMAGTFYRTPAPGEPQFAKEGDRVTKGQTIGIIEAMKLMNEIEAEMSGEVVKFVVENGAAVNPGQPLVIIKP